MNIIPSRVHVSVSLLSRFRFLASQAIVDRVLVMSSLMNVDDPLSLRAARITATFVLCVVKRTMRSRGVRRSSSLRPTRCERTMSWSTTGTSSLRAASSFTRASVFSFRASGMPLMRTVLRNITACRSSAHVTEHWSDSGTIFRRLAARSLALFSDV